MYLLPEQNKISFTLLTDLFLDLYSNFFDGELLDAFSRKFIKSLVKDFVAIYKKWLIN